jgi:ribonucleoside-diphosphate reductase alpha chain
MYCIKRNKQKVPLLFDSITKRNEELCKDLIGIDPARLSQLVIRSLSDGMTTSQIDILSAETCCSLSTYNPKYEILASRISVSNLHKETPKTFGEYLEIMKYIYNEDVYNFAKHNLEEIEKIIDCKKDYNYSFFGLKTLEHNYLLRKRINNDNINQIIERPQYLLMRVAIGIHYILPKKQLNIINNNIEYDEQENKKALEKVISTYIETSDFKFTHATPTLFNSGTISSSLSSCFLLSMDDTVESMYECIKRCSLISKSSGGIGINVSGIRSKGSVINSSGCLSDGIIPLLKVFESTAKHINQGGKRKGSIAVYLEMWHPDIMEFLELRLNNGQEDMRTRELFIALWIDDVFMNRLKNNKVYSLFCPYKIKTVFGKGFEDVYGEEFEKMYIEAENKQLYVKQYNAFEIWNKVLHSQIETGLPYIMYKDHVNMANNQKNIGIIKGSNLCSEITEVTGNINNVDNLSVCNLASIALNKYIIRNENGKAIDYNFKELGRITEIVTENLNKVIDRTTYPVKESKTTNLSHRPIGIGVQGLADVFFEFKYCWDSNQAKELNKKIFQTIYYNALNKSCDLAIEYGSYDKFDNSPLSFGILHCDMYNVNPYLDTNLLWDWNGLREKVKKGVRNSLLIACVPTASTSQILGNCECFEPLTSNIYSRKVLSGDFPIINKYLYEDMKKHNLWTKENVDTIIRYGGSVKNIQLPENLNNVYLTSWELSMKTIIDLASDRQPYVDQAQSLNLFFDRPNISKLSSCHMYSWSKKLKNGNYYIRSKPVVDAVKFSLDKEVKKEEIKIIGNKKVICTDDICISCSG